MADNPILSQFFALLRTELPPLLHSGNPNAGVAYADTREPILYDYHMPPKLRLVNLRYDSRLSSELTEKLAATLSQRQWVKDQSMDLETIESLFISTPIRGLIPPEAVEEGCVRDVQRTIYNSISSPLATLSCFDIDNTQLKQFPYVFGAFNSDQSNTKADLVIGCTPRPRDEEPRWGTLWSSVKDLRNPYFRVLHTEETKNIRAGNPRTILGIFIIAWCLEKGYLATFWPRNRCEDCLQFRKSHRAEDQDEENSEEPPLDGTTVTAETELLPGSNANPLRDEIDRIIALDGVYRQTYNIPAESERTVRKRKRSGPGAIEKSKRTIKRRRPRQPETETETETETEVEEVEEFIDYKQLLEEAMEKASDDLDLPENIKKGLIRWVENGARMLIQVWSHMVRHNATFAQLTSYNLGVIVSRHRATGTLTISNFLEHTDTPILRATALTVYAYHDAVERYDEHIAQDLPLWIEDPYRAQTKATQAAEKAKHDEDEDQEDDEDSDENDDSNDDNGENDSNGDDDESDRDAGPSGGNGGARGGTGRGGGGDHSGSGPAPSRGGPGGNNRSGPATQGSAARAARATGRARSASRLDLDSVHLAFKVPKKHLWSTGFSHFSRMGPKTAVELNNPPNLDLITPVQEDVPVHFLENSALQYSVDQRRVSAGSARSSASSASASTRTSVPSLFSEPASSAPTSPSTTSSFTHASRDTSPFPEKANHPADDHSSTSATVCDAAGILIDDVLGESAIGTVWSGKMILEDGSEDDASIAIAVKMAIPRDNGGEEENESDAIRWESSVYDVLAQSGKQGISPQYYGAFEDRTGAVILVLDNAGTALKSFGTLKKRSRRALFAKAVEMHSVGIRHNDLVPRNIIQDPEGELTIIDFHIADLNHHCRGKDKCRELLEFHAALNL